MIETMKTLKDKLFDILTQSEDDWRFDQYHALHVPSEMHYWIANGLLCFRNEGDRKASLGFLNWIRLYFWIKI